MIKYGIPEADDINSLKELWLMSFSDTEKSVDLFFNVMFSPEKCYVAKEDEKLIAMLYLFNTEINSHKAVYLYAAATLPSHRGRGIMCGLVHQALFNCDADLCVTLPASSSLYNYYESIGFKKIFSNTSILSRKALNIFAQPYQSEPIDVDYYKVRNRVLKNDFLIWDKKHIDYAFEYESLYGAKILKNNYGYAVLSENGDFCNVLEVICDDDDVHYMLYDILNATKCKEFKFHLSPNQKFIFSCAEQYGMVRYLSGYIPDNIYLGLALD